MWVKKECGGAEGKTGRWGRVKIGVGWGAGVSLEGEPEDPRNQYWEDKKRRLRKELGWEVEGLGTPERGKK